MSESIAWGYRISRTDGSGGELQYWVSLQLVQEMRDCVGSDVAMDKFCQELAERLEWFIRQGIILREETPNGRND